MRLHFHGDETFEHNPEFAFKKIPDGAYMVRTTVGPTGEESFEPYDFEWPVVLKDGVLKASEVEIPQPNA